MGGGKAAVRPGSRLWLAPRKSRESQVCDNPFCSHYVYSGRRRKRAAWGKFTQEDKHGLSAVAADLRLRNRATGLDLSKTLAKMEVASALLEASKKLSGSADSSTSSSCSATWSSSINEVND